jgi:hypothetical protein
MCQILKFKNENNNKFNPFNYSHGFQFLEEIKDINKIIDPVKKLIVEWCLDDNGVNLLYKNNGDERYPDFKLYKMIARHVHNHNPQIQLERPEFKQFLIENNQSFRNDIHIDKKQNTIRIDIDKIPSLV